MKKILIATLLLTTACSSTITPVAKTAAYFIAAPKIGVAIVIPELLIGLSAEQRAYNLKHGITHSREERENAKR